jgi:hypothetical protein
VGPADDVGPFGWPVPDGDRSTAKEAADAMSPWGVDTDVAALETRPRLSVSPDLVLRQLDPAPLAEDGERITEDLRALYGAITAGAAALALDESPQ